VNLVQNLERLKLDVDRILPLHSRAVPMSELLAQVGRRQARAGFNPTPATRPFASLQLSPR
jgi:hypothetical protein